MKIVFCQAPKSFIFAANPLTIPNGLLYMAAYLQKEGFSVEVIDPLPYNLSLKETIKKVKEAKPDLLGIYITTDNRFKAFHFAKAIKEIMNIPIVAGGPHPTLCAENTLKNFPQIDIIVRGEGEYSILKIAQAIADNKKDLSSIPNVSFRIGNTIIHNPETYLIPDLNSIPYPAYDLIDIDAYNSLLYVKGHGMKKDITILTSRGCPFKCIFCSSSEIWTRKTRYVAIDRVLDQIELVIDKYKIENISFYDDTLNINKKRLISLCEGIIKRKIKVHWDSCIRADNIDEELFTIMKESGCHLIDIGLESGDEYIRNKIIEKRITDEMIYKADNLAHKLDIRVDMNVMISFPEEDKKMAEKTFEFAKKLHANSAINIARIYPGTMLETIAKEKGILDKRFSWADPIGHKKYGPLYVPGLLGDYPLYKEKLSTIYLFEKLFDITRGERWSFDKRKFPLTGLAKKYLGAINYYKDFIIFFLIGISFLIWLSKKILKKFSKK